MFESIRVGAYGSKVAVFIEETKVWRASFGDLRFTRVFEHSGRFDELSSALKVAYKRGVPFRDFGWVCYAALMWREPIETVYTKTIEDREYLLGFIAHMAKCADEQIVKSKKVKL